MARYKISLRVFWVLAVLLLPGCKQKVPLTKKTPLAVSKGARKLAGDFQMKVTGIECQFCAQTVTDALALLDEIHHASYFIPDVGGDDYENGVVVFEWVSNKINADVRYLHELLGTKGFEVVALDGRFRGRFGLQDGKVVFFLSNSAFTAEVSSIVGAYTPMYEIPRKLRSKKTKVFAGTFWISEGMDKFIFSPAATLAENQLAFVPSTTVQRTSCHNHSLALSSAVPTNEAQTA